MKSIINGIKLSSIVLLTAIFLIGCDDDDNGNLPQVVADFTFTVDQTTGTVTFINTSEEADDFSWAFGDAASSTSDNINPVFVYETGTYEVTLTATNDAGASDTFTSTISINIPLPVTFPITFDDANVVYEPTVFNGATFEVVTNPDPSGTNTSTGNVGAITNSGAAFEGVFFALGTPLNLSEGNAVRMNFWSDTPVDVLLKLEQGTGADVEVTTSHGGTGWESLEFNFEAATASYSQMTIFVDGPGTTAGTFYIDDFEQFAAEFCPADPTFDSGLLVNGDFEDGATGWTIGTGSDPAPVTEDCDAFYSVNVETAGQPFDVNVSQTGLDITEGMSYTLTFDAWSDVNRNIIAGIGLSGAPFTNQSETIGITTERTTYTRTLVANFTDNSNSRVLFDVGAETGMVNIDNVSLVLENGGGGGGGTTELSVPEDFENGEVFSNIFDGPNATGMNAANPSMTGINTSANVFQFNKSTGSPWFSGFEGNFGPIGVVSGQDVVIRAKFYSTKANINIQMQLNRNPTENSQPNYSNVQVLTTANQWVEVTFTITAPTFDNADLYETLVFIPDWDIDNQVNRTTDEVYYIDDIVLVQ